MIMNYWKVGLLIFVLVLSLSSCTTTGEKQSDNRDLDPEYQYEKAVVAYRYGLPEEALKYLQRTLELAPEHSAAYNLLGLIYFDQGNLSQAIGYYQQAVALNPQLAEAYYGLGRAYEELGDKEKAQEAYRQSYQLKPTPEASFSWAKSLYGSQRLEEALTVINQTLSETPSVQGYNLQGVILNHLGRYREAVRSFEQALKLAPEDEVAAVNLGVALVNCGEKDRARKLFEELLPKIKRPELKARVEDFLRQIKK
ncbi:MAG TPA: tetratricopeptide repeat protein [Candidatus Aminicenantes bacterium]|nr:tetratricopeptide repeat protein [Candidatus Aminicenantes bacterium]